MIYDVYNQLRRVFSSLLCDVKSSKVVSIFLKVKTKETDNFIGSETYLLYPTTLWYASTIIWTQNRIEN